MASADITLPASGPYAHLAGLIALRFPARQLRLERRSRALSLLSGPNKSNFRGRGIDFEEVRSYQPGDDIRTIDWRVTARTGDAHTKMFREERERPVLVVIDQRNRMFFGSRHCFKSVLAAQLGALLCWSALENGDRVGGLVFNDRQHRDIRPRRSRKTVLALLSELISYNQALPDGETPAQNFVDVLSKMRRVARPGSSVYIVSDFAGFERDGAAEHLYQLAQHTEVTALCCSDPLESELPRAGNYVVTDGQQRVVLNTATKSLRSRFQAQASARHEMLTQVLQPLGIPLLKASTAQSPFQLLQTYYGDSRR
ncbi:MAG: DUF58 domain-containing protein [Pseudomonadota bacterium]